MKIQLGGMFATMLAIMFIGLKITNNIDWSWWWVLSPMWIPPLFIICFLSVVFFIKRWME